MSSLEQLFPMRRAASLGTGERNDIGNACGPVFILGLPRCFTSICCGMFGQHPQLYGLPEILLFSSETLAEWLDRCSRPPFHYQPQGVLRVISELYFGEQTEKAARLASGWLARRSFFTTGMLLETIADRVHPRILVDKSPSTIFNIAFMRRAYRMFPGARFVHLVRHPRGYGESVLKYMKQIEQTRPLPNGHWLKLLSSYTRNVPGLPRLEGHTPDIDPQRSWFYLNTNILRFLATVPGNQQMLIRGEELLTDQDRILFEFANWMRVRTDPEAIDSMRHPERSPYARFGPRNARFGNDLNFLRDPQLRPERGVSQSLEGPLSWREDGAAFLPRVRLLAQRFGYS